MTSSLLPNWKEFKKKFTVYEDGDILALNKPCGITVVGDRNEIDIYKLAKTENELILPVHRIDKATSGLILFAKRADVHSSLTRQFNKRLVTKTYLAVIDSTTLPNFGTINLPLSIGRKNKERIAAKKDDIKYDEEKSLWYVEETKLFINKSIYPSTTVIATALIENSHTLLAVRPITGRKHQIRVHLAWIGYPIKGDPLFNKTNNIRTFLHSWSLEFFKEWEDNRKVLIEAMPDDSFWSDFNQNQAIPLVFKARQELSNYC